MHLWVKWEKDVSKAPNSCQKLLAACMTFAHAEDMQYFRTRHWFEQSHRPQFFCFTPRHETMMSLLQHWSASLLKIPLQNNMKDQNSHGPHHLLLLLFFFFSLYFFALGTIQFFNVSIHLCKFVTRYIIWKASSPMCIVRACFEHRAIKTYWDNIMQWLVKV